MLRIYKMPELTSLPSTLIKHHTKIAHSLTSALHVGVSPEQLLALAAGAASKSRHALALPCELRPENRAWSRAAEGQKPACTFFVSCQLGEVGPHHVPEKASTSWTRKGTRTSILGAESPLPASPNCFSAIEAGKAQSTLLFIYMFLHKSTTSLGHLELICHGEPLILSVRQETSTFYNAEYGCLFLSGCVAKKTA